MTATIQLSGKANGGQIFVVGGNTFDEFFGNLVAALEGDQATAEATVREAARLLVPATVGSSASSHDEFQQAAQTVHTAFPQSRPAAQQAPAPQQQRQAAGPPPGSQPPVCNHGWAREWKSGTSKAGKPYKMWSCTADRSEQCEPIWVR